MITHVETVVLLSKLNDAKHHIEFEVSLEELGVTSAEAKATYEMKMKYKDIKENEEIHALVIYKFYIDFT